MPHSTTEHLTILFTYPDHEPRASDPHYHLFNEARKRLAAAGKLVCWIGNADCDHTHPIELHHSEIEFALANDIDPHIFGLDHPALGPDCDEEAFLAYVEGEGNLLPLCKLHHTGALGIHSVTYPGWKAQKYLKQGVTAPERKVVGEPG